MVQNLTNRIAYLVFCLVMFLALLLMQTNVYQQSKTAYYSWWHNIHITEQDIEYNNNELVRMTHRLVRAANPQHIMCAALGVYFEARGEPLLGQIAVARVIQNRMNHIAFPNDPCKVVYQKHVLTNKETGETRTVCQFSWACDEYTIPHKSDPGYIRALAVAKDVIQYNKWREVLTDNTLFFHNTDVQPGWLYKQVQTIGNHVFYAKEHKNK